MSLRHPKSPLKTACLIAIAAIATAASHPLQLGSASSEMIQAKLLKPTSPFAAAVVLIRAKSWPIEPAVASIVTWPIGAASGGSKPWPTGPVAASPIAPITLGKSRLTLLNTPPLSPWPIAARVGWMHCCCPLAAVAASAKRPWPIVAVSAALGATWEPLPRCCTGAGRWALVCWGRWRSPLQPVPPARHSTSHRAGSLPQN